MACLISAMACFARKDTADGEEGRLHDGVHASAHAGLFSDIVAVDDIELEFLLDDILLHFTVAV